MQEIQRLKLLVTGASGYLGQHLLKALLEEENYDLTAAYGSLESFQKDCETTFSKDGSKFNVIDGTTLDWASETSVQNFFLENTFDVIINLAAMSSPYKCEHDTGSAISTNCPKSLISALTRIGETTKVIQLSTDQVYDGFHAPYVEEDEASPVNFYGKSKLEFERLLLSTERAKIKPIILRSSLILGDDTPGICRKQSFLQFVKERLLNQQETDFYSNEYRNVVFTEDVVKVIKYFIKNECLAETPVFNMGGKDRVSRVQIAEEVAKVLGVDSKFIKKTQRAPMVPLNVTVSNDEIIVRSPPDISMNICKIQEETGIIMLGLEDLVRKSLKG